MPQDGFEQSTIGFAFGVCLLSVACGGVTSSSQPGTGGLGSVAGANNPGAGSAGVEVGLSTAGAADGGVMIAGPDLGCGPGSGLGLSDSSDPVRADAERRGLSTLDFFVGRFLSGRVPVYRGTLQARDNASALGSTDDDIPLGPAVADLQLGIDNGVAGVGDSLFVFRPSLKKYLQLHQPVSAPGTTLVFMILDEGTSGGAFGPCQDCAPRFADLPQNIALNGASGSNTELGFATTVSTNLERAAPCSLTFEELETLDSWESSPMFESRGGEFVLHLSDQYVDRSSEGDPCWPGTRYTIDVFVNASKPWIFGIRNFVAGSQFVACPV